MGGSKHVLLLVVLCKQIFGYNMPKSLIDPAKLGHSIAKHKGIFMATILLQAAYLSSLPEFPENLENYGDFC